MASARRSRGQIFGWRPGIAEQPVPTIESYLVAAKSSPPGESPGQCEEGQQPPLPDIDRPTQYQPPLDSTGRCPGSEGYDGPGGSSQNPYGPGLGLIQPSPSTPGRLVDQINRPRLLKLKPFTYKVIGEADEMVQSDWENVLKHIMPGGGGGNMTMFSATFPRSAEDPLLQLSRLTKFNKITQIFRPREELVGSKRGGGSDLAPEFRETLGHLYIVIKGWARGYANTPQLENDQEVIKNNPEVGYSKVQERGRLESRCH
ncbi:uncharacterized protein PAC_03984 [Phialocephala subalpina]|uniref:Uncharacterized protein n=1 Tax=Phialocephala subalpina TaxID=576137 RepID=A0A1L7WMV9_9HELO|nr:uncharacterized protein PAC_03984 [Phialocephala subalpina]